MTATWKIRTSIWFAVINVFFLKRISSLFFQFEILNFSKWCSASILCVLDIHAYLSSQGFYSKLYANFPTFSYFLIYNFNLKYFNFVCINILTSFEITFVHILTCKRRTLIIYIVMFTASISVIIFFLHLHFYQKQLHAVYFASSYRFCMLLLAARHQIHLMITGVCKVLFSVPWSLQCSYIFCSWYAWKFQLYAFGF